MSTSSMAAVTRYGGPIVYLILYALTLFVILVWVDTGSSLVTQRLSAQIHGDKKPHTDPVRRLVHEDVDAEASKVAASSDSSDSLRVLNIAKTFGSSENRVVDDVTFGVSQNTIFALLGPNGAGKTTTFNIIRESVLPA